LGVIVALISFVIGTWYLSTDGFEQVWVPGSPSSTPGHYETRVKLVISEKAKQLQTNWANALARKVEAFAHRKQADLSAKLNACMPEHVPTLIVRTKEPDEAVTILQKSDQLGWLGSILSSPGLAAGVVVFLLIGCTLPSLGLGIYFSVNIIQDALRAHKFGLGIAVASLLSGAWITCLAAMILGVLCTLILGVLTPLSVLLRAPAFLPALLSYGSADLVAEYFMHTRVRADPIAWKVDPVAGFELREYTFAHRSGFDHSKYYVNPVVLKDISKWLRKRYDGSI
jgi:hypothetical protein